MANNIYFQLVVSISIALKWYHVKYSIHYFYATLIFRSQTLLRSNEDTLSLAKLHIEYLKPR